MKTYSPFNGAMVAILWISIIANAISILNSLSRIDTMPLDYLSIILALVTISGAYLILRLNKWGYWLMVGPRILMMVIGLTMISSIDVGALFLQNLGQIAFLSLLMLLKKDGMNAYQVLWLKLPPEESQEE